MRCTDMSDFLNLILLVGGVISAGLVGVMCGVTLFVWLSGSRRRRASKTWRASDES